jgi:hypothetical protein
MTHHQSSTGQQYFLTNNSISVSYMTPTTVVSLTTNQHHPIEQDE